MDYKVGVGEARPTFMVEHSTFPLKVPTKNRSRTLKTPKYQYPSFSPRHASIRHQSCPPRCFTVQDKDTFLFVFATKMEAEFHIMEKTFLPVEWELREKHKQTYRHPMEFITTMELWALCSLCHESSGWHATNNCCFLGGFIGGNVLRNVKWRRPQASEHEKRVGNVLWGMKCVQHVDRKDNTQFQNTFEYRADRKCY